MGIAVEITIVECKDEFRDMALIVGFDRSSNEAQKLHSPVRCGYRAFTVDGMAVVQLDTYGTEDRKFPGKISQSLQLDLDSARELIGILRDAFPDLG